MSLRYKGAVISATPPTVSATSPNAYGTAKGVWTLQQQMQYEGAGTWPNPFTPVYIEDIFSTWLYTGNGSTQTITNGIDLSTKGGLVWTKNRTGFSATHQFIDTVRGKNSALASQNTDSALGASDITSFNATGFSLGYITGNSNFNNDTYASWTFREQPKFFDIVTYTGNGSNRTIAHNLGSVPGCIIVKSTSNSEWWAVQHRSLGATKTLYLNSTNAEETNATNWNNTNPTSTEFTVGTNTPTNANGQTYVAYLFAHNAGGFGDSGSDNVISCGSFVGSSSSAVTVTLGYEPQYILMKDSSGAGSWWLWDTMRGLVVDGGSGTGDKYLFANASSAEAGTYGIDPTATGFIASAGWSNGATYIYIAIRRGPMKTPTTGTSVFLPSTAGATTPFSVGFVPDMGWFRDKSITNNTTAVVRLTGAQRLRTNLTNAESLGGAIGWDANTNFWYQNDTGGNLINWLFRRAPGFFDVVCFTGDGTGNQMVTHNLGVTPELIITKKRSGSLAFSWYVYGYKSNSYLILNQTDAEGSATITAATSTQFSVFAASDPQVAYLFATCAGVSKVGSYTGTGTTLQVNCGFTGGARFVLIKRTDSTGDWYVWDSARGIVAGNDPYLLLNSTAAEVTNTDYVDTYSAGFEISSTAPAAINANGGTFIFLAIA